MRRYAAQSLIFPLILVLCLASENRLLAYPDKGTVITVNDVGDTVDAAPGDGVCADAAGKCTLRAAIMESNTTAGSNAIIFDVPVPAVITLTIDELQVTKPLFILGRGARKLTIQRSTTPNFANFRVFNLGANTRLRGLTIKNGSSLTSGGGILAAANLSLLDVAITGNRARSGGGIAFQASQESTSTIERCLINSNTALAEGGGLYISAGTYPSLKSTTITANSAVAGGGIASYGGLISVNNTVARNAASQAGSGILIGTGGQITVLNTIIGPDPGQTVSLVQGQFQSEGSNIVTDSTNSSGWLSSDQVSTTNAIDPMLGPLANNGGQTDTLALLPSSPAINRGDFCVYIFGCVSPGNRFDTRFDQRKYIRMAGNSPDIGAYESGSALTGGTYTIGLIFDNTQRLAFSKVTATNTETMEKRTSYITLWEPFQGRPGSTPRMIFNFDDVFVVQVHTKRGTLFSPVIYTAGGAGGY